MSDFSPNDAYKTPTSAPAKENGIISSEERTWAMASHLVPLLGYVVPIPFFNIAAPGIVWFLKRETMPFVDDQAKESLNFQITVFLAAVVCLILVLFVIGFLLLCALAIYSLVMMVLAAKSAQDGKPYRYPICIRFLS